MANATDDNAPRDVSRRSLFKQVGAASAAAMAGTPLAPGLAQERAAPNPTATAQLEALETLTAAEADTLEAIVARLIPTDENGPGAAEAHAAHYIDRALAGPLRSSREAYAAGLDALDAYAQSKNGAPFARLSAPDQDAVLADMETNIATVRAGCSNLLRSRAQPHDPGHVLRSLLRRQCQFRRLGPDRISRPAHGGRRGRAAHESAELRAQIGL
jgi:hypothetical protein